MNQVSAGKDACAGGGDVWDEEKVFYGEDAKGAKFVQFTIWALRLRANEPALRSARG